MAGARNGRQGVAHTLLGLGLLALLAAGCEVKVGSGDFDGGLFDDDPFADEAPAGDDGTAGQPVVMDAPDASAAPDTRDAGQSAPSDAVTDPVPEPAPTLDLDAFCEALYAPFRDYTDWVDRCCGEDERTLEAFLGSELEFYAGLDGSEVTSCITRWQDFVDGGSVIFDGAMASACAGALAPPGLAAAPAECGGFVDLDEQLFLTAIQARASLAQVASCRATFAGTLELGQACEDDMQCVGDLRCRQGADDDSPSCQPVRAAGAGCDRSSECAQGQICGGDPGTEEAPIPSACVPPAGEGGGCSSGRGCMPGLLCRKSNLDDDSLTENTCIVPGGTGEICTDDVDCRLDHFCDGSACAAFELPMLCEGG